MSLLGVASRRHLLRHPGQSGLCLFGVAVGVAVVLAIDLAISSSQKALEDSVDTMRGRATHRIVGGSRGVADDVYVRLRRQVGRFRLAPIVERPVELLTQPGRRFTLLGIDPYAEVAFRPHLRLGGDDWTPEADFYVEPGTVLMEEDRAASLGLEIGDPIALRIGTFEAQARLGGRFRVDDPDVRKSAASVILADIATAQELTRIVGRLSRIEMILEDGDAPPDLDRLTSEMDTDGVGHGEAPLQIIDDSDRSRRLDELTRAFRLNLRFLSLLALVVGVFLIFNFMTFSVVQRRDLFGRLRSIGVSRPEIMRTVLGEAALVGTIGSALGVGLGYLLAKGLIGEVARTIDNLYVAVEVSELHVTPMAVVKAVGLGLFATIGAASWPAREATRASPRAAMRRSDLEAGLVRRSRVLLVVASLAAMISFAALRMPGRGLLWCYVSVLAAIVAFAAVAPPATSFLARVLRPLASRVFGVLGRMATRGIETTLSRSAPAVAALAMALAMTFGVGVMITSFRSTVVSWLGDTLRADIYVTLPDSSVRLSEPVSMRSSLLAEMAAVEGVRAVDVNRTVNVRTDHGESRLVALRFHDERMDGYRYVDRAKDHWSRFRAGAVFVSEPYANRHGVEVGDVVEVATDRGRRRIDVVAIFHDYATEQGYLLMAEPKYRELFDDDGVTAVAIFVEDGASVSEIALAVDRLAGPGEDIVVRSQRAIRENSITIFDRTFAITSVLRLLAVVVAVVGISSSLMALQLERAREMAGLRAIGLTPKEVGGLAILQSALTGLIAGLLAIPLGVVFAVILTGPVNLRSFGWSLPVDWSVFAVLECVAWGVGAALLAGIVPTWRMLRAEPAAALRGE